MTNAYILKLKDRRVWRWGIVRYSSLEEAQNRVNELGRIGIRAKIYPESDLYGTRGQSRHRKGTQA